MVLNDYKQVKICENNGVRPLNVNDTVRLHEEDKAWLIGQIEEARS